MIVTGMKNQVWFIQYGIEVVRAKLRGERLPLPFGCDPGYQLAVGRHRPASARAPCPPSRLGLRRHARGHQPVPAPGTVSISPDLPQTIGDKDLRPQNQAHHEGLEVVES